MEHGYKRDGDTVVLTMSIEDHEALRLCLDFSAGAVRASPFIFWSRIGLVNRLNAGNPSFLPFEIPEEHR